MNTHTNAPAFQIYPRDELTDLAGVSVTAHGIYSRLRCHCWLRGALPRALPAIAKLAGVPLPTFRRAWRELAGYFERTRAGGYVLADLEHQRQRHEAHRKIRAENGADGARVRWSGHVPRRTKNPYSVIVRLAHDVITNPQVLEETRGDVGAMIGRLKDRLADLSIDYADDPRVLHRAFDAACFQQREKFQRKNVRARRLRA